MLAGANKPCGTGQSYSAASVHVLQHQDIVEVWRIWRIRPLRCFPCVSPHSSPFSEVCRASASSLWGPEDMHDTPSASAHLLQQKQSCSSSLMAFIPLVMCQDAVVTFPMIDSGTRRDDSWVRQLCCFDFCSLFKSSKALRLLSNSLTSSALLSSGVPLFRAAAQSCLEPTEGTSQPVVFAICFLCKVNRMVCW